MKVRSLKKNIKQELFNLSISKNLFMVFENKHDSLLSKSFSSNNIITESVSKQIFNKLKLVEYSKIKFPIRIRSLVSLNDLLFYFSSLKESNKTLSVFLVKAFFLIIKKNIYKLSYIFSIKKNILFFNFILFIFIKRRVLTNIFNSVTYPFVL